MPASTRYGSRRTGVYTGTSENNGELEIRQTGDMAQGTITTPEGRVVNLLAYDLTRVLDWAWRAASRTPTWPSRRRVAAT